MALELAVFVAVAIVWGDLRYQVGGMKAEIRNTRAEIQSMKDRCKECYAPISKKGGGA